jgi:hypothetical protein
VQQRKLVRRWQRRLIIQACARQIDKAALPRQAQGAVDVDQRAL